MDLEEGLLYDQNDFGRCCCIIPLKNESEKTASYSIWFTIIILMCGVIAFIISLSPLDEPDDILFFKRAGLFFILFAVIDIIFTICINPHAYILYRRIFGCGCSTAGVNCRTIRLNCRIACINMIKDICTSTLALGAVLIVITVLTMIIYGIFCITILVFPDVR